MSWVSKLTTLAMTFFATGPPEGKRGLAWPWYNENSNLDPAKLANDQVQWIYNWETWRPAKTTGLNWIGTQRCMDCESSPISQLKTRADQQGWNTVLTLNEPDINYISPETAANWYIQHINPLQIKKAIPSCYFDYVNLHWYGHNFDEFKSHVENAHSRFPDHQLIISEFALLVPASRDQQVEFLRSAMSFLDNADYVKYYAVFAASSPAKITSNAGGDDVGVGSSLYENGGSLSANGIAYRE
ncbi:hypothetical protein RSOLAG22IIIB_06215 [Rhizoctonia solani]|uniref:Asl1-like glycosyl hydrolase catalytic domain-containing protein n=1 Tax=Rhizoctonia solani TaxID=456999 RepID=A0A0K6GCW9_9AGAM|nr:hypothetical protein RSOLAG22IIIB_06215 [Rhizoctonia solani]